MIENTVLVLTVRAIWDISVSRYDVFPLRDFYVDQVPQTKILLLARSQHLAVQILHILSCDDRVPDLLNIWVKRESTADSHPL